MKSRKIKLLGLSLILSLSLSACKSDGKDLAGLENDSKEVIEVTDIDKNEDFDKLEEGMLYIPEVLGYKFDGVTEMKDSILLDYSKEDDSFMMEIISLEKLGDLSKVKWTETKEINDRKINIKEDNQGLIYSFEDGDYFYSIVDFNNRVPKEEFEIFIENIKEK